MNFYLLFSFCVGLIIVLGYKNKNVGLFLLFVLFFLSAFRGIDVGHDTKNYINSIRDCANLFDGFTKFEFEDLGKKVEIINNFINKIIYDFNLDARCILLFYSLITIYFLYLAIKRFNSNLAYALTFYVLLSFYFYSLTAARQLSAVSIILYGYSFLQNNKSNLILFASWIVIASLIHSFSIFAILIFFIRFTPILNNKISNIIFIICLFLTFVRFDFLSNISKMLDMDHITSYLYVYGDGGGHNITGKIVNCIFLSFVYYIFISNHKCWSKGTQFIDNMFLFSLLIFSALSNYDGIVGRIHYNFSIIQCVVLSRYLVRRVSITNQYRLILLLFIFLCSYLNKSYLGILESNYHLCF